MKEDQPKKMEVPSPFKVFKEDNIYIGLHSVFGAQITISVEFPKPVWQLMLEEDVEQNEQAQIDFTYYSNKFKPKFDLYEKKFL